MQVSGLNIHPVKSTAIRALDRARLVGSGLVDDRRWMVVDGSGSMVSARTDRRLFTIVARTRAVDGIATDLELTAPGQVSIELDRPSGVVETFILHGNAVTGINAGSAAATWLCSALERDDVRLVWCADPTARQLDPAHSQPTDGTAFADGYPVLLTSTASLTQLDDWMITAALERGEDPPEPLSMQRFRPNVVIDDVAEPFAEDGWSRIKIGDCVLRVVQPCDRCVMTLIDPISLQIGKEPMRSLVRHRRVDGTTLFGQNLIPDRTGLITVGDRVEVLEWRAGEIT